MEYVIIDSEGGIIQDICQSGNVRVLTIDWDECADGNLELIEQWSDELDSLVDVIPSARYVILRLALDEYLEKYS